MTTPVVPSGLPGVAIRAGDHVCAFYRGQEERDAVLLPYLRAGLQAGDTCIGVLDSTPPSELAAELRADVDRSTGTLQLHRSEDAYLAGGGFSSDRMIDFWEDGASTSFAQDGCSFLRVVGEMTWALRNVPGVEDLVLYESELNRFLPRYPQVVLCLYDLERFADGEILFLILRTHPVVLMSGLLLDNPWFTEPDELLLQLT